MYHNASTGCYGVLGPKCEVFGHVYDQYTRTCEYCGIGEKEALMARQVTQADALARRRHEYEAWEAERDARLEDVYKELRCLADAAPRRGQEPEEEVAEEPVADEEKRGEFDPKTGKHVD